MDAKHWKKFIYEVWLSEKNIYFDEKNLKKNI